MKNRYKYPILLFLILPVLVLTFVKSPDELIINLNSIASETKQLAVLMHGVFLILLVIGFAVKKAGQVLFPALILILSGLALFMALKYHIPPNIIVFGTIFSLALKSVMRTEMRFDVSNVGKRGKLIAFLSLFFGFYYLHWVEAPVWKNALFYSPLGIINCPTLLSICGLLIFLKRPGPSMLELLTGCMTLYFGFFGIMRLGAEIDIFLIISGSYLIFRQIQPSSSTSSGS